MTSSIWRNRDFLLLFSGQTVSQLGTAISTFVIPWLLLQLTGSATQTGIAFAVGFVPYLFLSLPAGVWSDRFNRKYLMILADIGRLLLLLSIPLAHVLIGKIPVLLLFSVQAGVSLFSAIFDSAYGSCLPNIVARSQLQAANATLQTGFSISRIGGPVVAGILVSLLGTANTLVLDVASYAVSMMTLMVARSSFSALQKNTSRASRNMLSDIHEGFHYIWKIKLIRTVALFSMLINLVGPGMDVALLFRIQHELYLPSRWSGVIMTGLSCGMVIGSIVIGRFNKRFRTRALITASILGLVLPPFVLSLSTSPIVIVITQFVTGILLALWNVQTSTLRQIIIPDNLLGRCVSVFRLIAWISIPVGDAIAGVVSQAFGSSFFFLIGGSVVLAVFLIAVSTKLHRVTEQDNPMTLLGRY